MALENAPASLSPEVLDDLYFAAGRENVETDPARRLMYGSDGTGRVHPPLAVVRAVDEIQVRRVLATCTEHGIPVVARGAGSGLTGGALAIAGGVILDMAGMDRIIRIDPADQVAVVQPGVVTARLQEAAAAQGLFYPPDPASVNFCTVGGNVAENAGGLRAVKYGVTRDYVLGLKAALPDGRLFVSGGANQKSVVGYDLTRLIVGSEGTLAVILELTLKLLPLPEAKATIMGQFTSLESSAAAVAGVLAQGFRPTALEFIDQQCLKAVEAYTPLGIAPEIEAMVLVELDGPPEVVARQSLEVEKILRDSGGGPVQVARDAKESDLLWKARRSLGPAVKHLAPGKLNEDVAVPLGKLAQLVRRLDDVARSRGVIIASFGHAGDGNLHVNVMYDPSDPQQTSQAHQAVTDVFAHTLALGGSLSGEHGVGNSKLGYVGAEIDPVGLELMQGIKKLFDPAGILNPGKAIPGPEILK